MPVEPGKFDFKFVQVYSPSNPVRAYLAGSYRLRRIESGSHTVIEGDDCVDYVDGAIEPQPVTLVSQDEIFAQNLTVGIEVRRGDDYLPLHVARKVTDNDSFRVEFFDVQDARRLIEWIGAKAGNNRLDDNHVFFVRDGRKLTALTPDDIDSMRVGSGHPLPAP